MEKRAIFALLLLAGCAHPYTLDPLGGKPEELNGIALATVVAPKCVFQAGYQYSNPQEMLVKIRITNKDKAAFEIDPTAFSMNGPKETLKTSPLLAVDPEKYLRELTAAAELLDSRTKMESYQGLDVLGELKGDTSDRTLDAAKDDYRRKQGEVKRSLEDAEALRKRIAVIQPAALRKGTVKPGETSEGALVFKAEFGETGVVTINSAIAACPGKLSFMLKR